MNMVYKCVEYREQTPQNGKITHFKAKTEATRKTFGFHFSIAIVPQ